MKRAVICSLIAIGGAAIIYGGGAFVELEGDARLWRFDVRAIIAIASSVWALILAALWLGGIDDD